MSGIGRHPQVIQAVRILIVAAVVFGCAAGVPPPSLEGREFVSVAVTEAGAARPLVPGTRVELRFEGGRIGIAAGCNSIGGAYRIEDGRLRVGDLSMTAMGCDAPRHAQDDWISTFVGSAPAIRLDGQNLALESGDTRLELVDREVVEPAVELIGSRWVVEGLVSGDVVSSMPAGVDASLVFEADGNLSLDAGCNVGSGPYAVADGVLQIGPLLLTRRGCQADEASVESSVLAVLEAGEVAFDLTGQVLMLEAGERALTLRADQPPG